MSLRGDAQEDVWLETWSCSWGDREVSLPQRDSKRHEEKRDPRVSPRALLVARTGSGAPSVLRA